MVASTHWLTMPLHARTSEDAVFAARYEKHRDRVYRFCLRYASGNASFAEDITQEVFIRLFEHLPRLKEVDDLGGWLYRVAANLSISRLRRDRSLMSWIRGAFGG